MNCVPAADIQSAPVHQLLPQRMQLVRNLVASLLDVLTGAPARMRAWLMRPPPRNAEMSRCGSPQRHVNPLGSSHESAEFNLLLQDLPNNITAVQLHRSARTVEDHVATVFVKMAVHSRVELPANFATPAKRD